MTAITTPSIRNSLRTSDDALLRFLVRVDATLTSFSGLLLAAAADGIAALTGYTPVELFSAGATFVAYGLVLFVLAAVENLRVVGTAVVAGNVTLALGAVAVVVAGWLPLTAFGAAATLGAAAFTLGFADLQYLGVRRIRA